MKFIILSILTLTLTAQAQQPQIMECMKGLTVYTVGSTLINVGAGSTNPVIQTGGLDLISAHCSGWNTDVILWFNTGCRRNWRGNNPCNFSYYCCVSRSRFSRLGGGQVMTGKDQP